MSARAELMVSKSVVRAISRSFHPHLKYAFFACDLAPTPDI